MSARADLEVRPGLAIPGGELVETASRSSGPGGQHVNKASTRVTLRWNVAESEALTPGQRARLASRLAGRLTRGGDLLVHAQRYRSRARNRELARQRLAELVRGALATRRPRRPTRTPRSVQRSGIESKRRRGAVKRTRGRLRAGDED